MGMLSQILLLPPPTNPLYSVVVYSGQNSVRVEFFRRSVYTRRRQLKKFKTDIAKNPHYWRKKGISRLDERPPCVHAKCRSTKRTESNRTVRDDFSPDDHRDILEFLPIFHQCTFYALEIYARTCNCLCVCVCV